ncbi:MAG: class I SAM-dependent methyltransferase [Saprospiraceae bacterium]|nr:class I SAM-dependent methyltransferase [Saprospiraceae bacterium]
MSTFNTEIIKGQRFEFGKNWQSFLSKLTEERIRTAESSVQEALQSETLSDKTVLDIGSGSGLFSLAARRLGAKVHSFDFDPASVSCAKLLRSRFFPNDPNWVIEEGSVLDEKYLNQLGKFDIVYSFGVLHHTGKMWTAIENAASLVNLKGTLYIAIYNDQGRKSRLWKKVKEFYCSGIFGKIIVSGIFIPYFFLRLLASSIIQGKNRFTEYKKNRGMSVIHDWIDWLGGYPFEVATIEEIFCFFSSRGWILTNIKTTCNLGNNEFTFDRK